MSDFYMGTGDGEAIAAIESARLREIDQTLRADLSGHPVDEIESATREAYAAFGIEISNPDYFGNYARAIADDKQWSFELGETLD
jgi:hypothetical protein